MTKSLVNKTIKNLKEIQTFLADINPEGDAYFNEDTEEIQNTLNILEAFDLTKK